MKELVLEQNIPQVTDQYKGLVINEKFLDYFTNLDEQNQKSTKEQLITLLKNQDIKDISISDKFQIVSGKIQSSTTQNTYELIVEAIEACKDLRNISLHHLNYDAKTDTKKLSDALKKHTQLESIIFSHCKLPHKKETLESLLNNKNLALVMIESSNIDDMDAKIIAQICKNNPQLEALWLHDNKIGDEGANAIAQLYKNNSAIKTLNLSDNQIGDEGAKAIAQLCKNNSAIKTLYLYHNKIGDEGAKAIAQLCENNTSLETLKLSDNQIGDEGAKAIAKALSKNNKINSLDLKNNPITRTAKKEVIKMLENTSIKGSVFYNDREKSLSLSDDLRELQKEEGILNFIDLIIQKARGNKYLCSDKKLLDELKTGLYNEFTLYNSKLISQKSNQEITEEVAKIGNTPEDKLSEKQQSLLKGCVKILKDAHIKDIKHKNPIMMLAQAIWQLFASIFYTADPLNDHTKGYQKIENTCVETNFTQKLLKSRQEQQNPKPTRGI